MAEFTYARKHFLLVYNGKIILDKTFALLYDVNKSRNSDLVILILILLRDALQISYEIRFN